LYIRLLISFDIYKQNFIMLSLLPGYPRVFARIRAIRRNRVTGYFLPNPARMVCWAARTDWPLLAGCEATRGYPFLRIRRAKPPGTRSFGYPRVWFLAARRGYPIRQLVRLRRSKLSRRMRSNARRRNRVTSQPGTGVYPIRSLALQGSYSGKAVLFFGPL